MKNIFKTIQIYLIFGLINSVAIADIREAPTMANAVLGIDDNSLVIFDLDNTVMMPAQSLGGEEWYDYFVEKRTKQFQNNNLLPEKAKEMAIDLGLAEWNQFHRNAKVIPVDADTPQLIQELQKMGAMTMALTARPIDLADPTINQLKSIGIDLSKNSVSKMVVKVNGEFPSQFKNGALLVGPKNNKGDVLVKFLKQLQLKPQRIFFIDNKMHHVENVERALKPLGIEYHGRRHGSADTKIKAMNPQIVELQHRYFFGDVLSNRQAKILLNAKP